jgi:hypothetical protein
MMSGVLLPVGNSLAEAAEKPWTDEVEWDVNEDDGTVFEAKDVDLDIRYWKPQKIETYHKKIKNKTKKKRKN